MNDTRMASAQLGRSVDPEPAGLAGCLLRSCWSLGGFSAVALVWIAIVRGPAWTVTWKDGLFWMGVLSMILARFIDVMRFRGRTMDGQPVTRAHLARYVCLTVVVSGSAWSFAQSIDL
jgi:hypothetical protein